MLSPFVGSPKSSAVRFPTDGQPTILSCTSAVAEQAFRKHAVNHSRVQLLVKLRRGRHVVDTKRFQRQCSRAKQGLTTPCVCVTLAHKCGRRKGNGNKSVRGWLQRARLVQDASCPQHVPCLQGHGQDLCMLRMRRDRRYRRTST